MLFTHRSLVQLLVYSSAAPQNVDEPDKRTSDKVTTENGEMERNESDVDVAEQTTAVTAGSFSSESDRRYCEKERLFVAVWI